MLDFGTNNTNDISCRKRERDEEANTVMSEFKEEKKKLDDETRCNNNKEQNTNLTKEEKVAKRELKKQFKWLAKIDKLETRIRHSISRKDPVIEQQARDELSTLLQESKSSCNNNIVMKYIPPPRFLPDPVKNEIVSIANQLFSRFSNVQPLAITTGNPQQSNEKEDGSSTIRMNESTKKTKKEAKRVQNEEAIRLLKHFTKGTQSHSMFRNHAALWGYTRQKFTERATLLCQSLYNLHPSQNHKATPTMKRIWDILSSQTIKSACSIGCGPGNDAFGLWIFLRHYANLHHQNTLERLLLLDWAIDEWKSTVLDPLQSMLVQEGGKEETNRMQMETTFCDVTKPLLNTDENQEALKKLIQEENITEPIVLNYEMFITSYVVSETRGKWNEFYQQLVQYSKPNTLFYFSEPTSWQLHKLCHICQDYLDFVWVDSSMYYPKLQSLEGRIGPAVLLAIRK